MVRQVLEAVNDKSVSRATENALPSFRGPGGIDLTECRRTLVGYFMRSGWLRAFERRLTVDLVEDGSGARARLEVVIAAGNPVEKIEDLLPTDATELIFDLELQRVGNDFKFVSAQVERRRPS